LWQNERRKLCEHLGFREVIYIVSHLFYLFFFWANYKKISIVILMNVMMNGQRALLQSILTLLMIAKPNIHKANNISKEYYFEIQANYWENNIFCFWNAIKKSWIERCTANSEGNCCRLAEVPNVIQFYLHKQESF